MQTRTYEPWGTLLRHDHPVMALAFGPDGKTLLTGVGDYPERDPDGNLATEDGMARVWEIAPGLSRPPTLWPKFTATRLAVSPDGRRLIAGSDPMTLAPRAFKGCAAVGPVRRRTGGDGASDRPAMAGGGWPSAPTGKVAAAGYHDGEGETFVSGTPAPGRPSATPCLSVAVLAPWRSGPTARC